MTNAKRDDGYGNIRRDASDWVGRKDACALVACLVVQLQESPCVSGDTQQPEKKVVAI